eukprot:6270474-Karenia_brevis.AAC.1
MQSCGEMLNMAQNMTKLMGNMDGSAPANGAQNGSEMPRGSNDQMPLQTPANYDRLVAQLNGIVDK